MSKRGQGKGVSIKKGSPLGAAFYVWWLSILSKEFFERGVAVDDGMCAIVFAHDFFWLEAFVALGTVPTRLLTDMNLVAIGGKEAEGISQQPVACWAQWGSGAPFLVQLVVVACIAVDDTRGSEVIHAVERDDGFCFDPFYGATNDDIGDGCHQVCAIPVLVEV